MKTDLVLTPFGASAEELLDAARAADAGGFDTVWTYDHFSGLVHGAPWSRDPFVILAAIAATTERINVGVLVANVANRHPAQLACAVNSLQSLAPHRVLLGVGAGTGANTPWSGEATAIGRPIPPAATRRAVLAETIAALRAIWTGDPFAGAHVQVAASIAVTDGAPMPPIIVGATSHHTIRIGCEHADGVNLLPEGNLAERVAFARATAIREPFEISAFLALDVDHPLGGDPAPLEALGIERRTLYVSVPFPVEAITALATTLEKLT